MQRILGLDLGTNSIGWAVVDKEVTTFKEEGLLKQKESYSLADKGVLIFSEGVKIEKGNESSKAAERTGYRSARRLKFRRKLRKFETLKVLIKHGMCPLSIDELNDWRSSVNPETGKKMTFKNYPSNPHFRQWLHTDNEGDEEERKRQVKNPYSLRARALDNKLSSLELGRVFYHMAQRRGFLSNRLDNEDTSILDDIKPDIQQLIEHTDSKTTLILDLDDFFDEYDLKEDENKALKTLKTAFDRTLKAMKDHNVDDVKSALIARLNKKENLGPVKRNIAELSERIEEGGFRTMGEYFYDCFKNGQKIRNQHTAREEHYLNEFEEICRAQKVDDDLKKQLVDAIFYQRPLKSQKGTVGKCSLEPAKSRCPVSHPDFEEFRMLSFVNNIKVKTPDDERLRFLDERERALVIEKFYRKKPNFPFEDLAKTIAGKSSYAYFKHNDAKDADFVFNYAMNTTIIGCPVSAVLRGIFGEDFKNHSLTYTIANPKGEIVSRSVDYHDLWHVLFTFDSSEKLRAFATEKLQLDSKQALSFARTRIKKDYAALSLKAIRKILPYLERGLLYSHAVFMGKMVDIIDSDKWHENEELLQETIIEIVDRDREDGKRLRVANDLYHHFKLTYANGDSKYMLDNEDRKMVVQKVREIYGQKSFENMGNQYRDDLIQDIEERFKEAIRKNRFLKKDRLDEKIIQFIDDHDLCSDSKRFEQLYHPSDIDKFRRPKPSEDGNLYLGSPMTNSIRNPMAMRALHQLRKLLNTLISEGVIDERTHINIELARELNDANKRKAIKAWQDQLAKERDQNRKVIIDLYKKDCGKEIVPSDVEVLKYKLWKEQNCKCVYTSKTIGICDFIGPDPKFDIEHTLPRSISEDDSQMNKTLCDLNYNRNIKKNRIPFECQNHDEILANVEHWKKTAEDLAIQMQRVTKSVKAATTKEQKDRFIEKRHMLRLEYDYFKGKHDRFTMKEVKSGFKNSQKVDIGIISKLSRAYLSSVFPRVNSVKGGIVDQFRKIWGLHELERDENGQVKHGPDGFPSYKPKDRSNHCHHCQDAVVIACLSKRHYDLLASAWREAEHGKTQKAKEILAESKPWQTFTEDIKKLPQEVLVVHHTPDNVGKQSKFKLRKRGKLQKNKNGEVVYLQGDTARGSLHKDSFYGAILRPEVNKKTGEILFDQSGEPKQKLNYVKRSDLSLVGDGDIKRIVDDRVRSIVEVAREKEKELIKQIKELEKHLKNAEEVEEAMIKSEIEKIKSTIANDLYVLPNKNGAPIPIKKVRMYQPTVTNPIHLKEHKDASRMEHKRNYHVMNDENYVMPIYHLEENGKIKKAFSIFNLLDYSNLLKSIQTLGNDVILPLTKEGLDLKYSVGKGVKVIFFQNVVDELKEMDIQDLSERFYTVIKFDGRPRLTSRHHTCALPAKEIDEKFTIDFTAVAEQLSLSLNNFNAAIEGEDFDLSLTGKITWSD